MPGHVRRRVHPVHVVREVHPSHAVGLEVALDELPERSRRESHQIRELVARDLPEPSPRAAAFTHLRPSARVEVGWLLEEEGLEVAGERVQPSMDPIERGGVRLRDARRELLHRTVVIGPPGHDRAVFERGLESGLARDHPQPVALEPEIADHLRPEHRRDVRGGRGATPRRDLLGDACASDDLPPLQHQRPETRVRPGRRRRSARCGPRRSRSRRSSPARLLSCGTPEDSTERGHAPDGRRRQSSFPMARNSCSASARRPTAPR